MNAADIAFLKLFGSSCAWPAVFSEKLYHI